MSYEEREPVEATVAELKPRMKTITITIKVVEIGEEREVSSRRDMTTHRVTDAVVGDSTGTVVMPLWDESIDNLTVGNTYVLKNGYTGLFKGNLRLNIGKYGEISDAEESIEEVNTENDMSAEEHEDDRRGGYGRGRGGYGGGRDRGYGGGGGYGGGRDRGGGGYGGGGGRDRRDGGYGGRDRRGGGRRY